MCNVEAELDSLVRFLHERGFILHFGDDPKSELRNWVFLSPQWLADVMKTVVRGTSASIFFFFRSDRSRGVLTCFFRQISVKHKYGKNGRLYKRDLAFLWRDYNTEIHSVLIELFKEFEILHPIKVTHSSGLA
jgi:hypothetical protein